MTSRMTAIVVCSGGTPFGKRQRVTTALDRWTFRSMDQAVPEHRTWAGLRLGPGVTVDKSPSHKQSCLIQGPRFDLSTGTWTYSRQTGDVMPAFACRFTLSDGTLKSFCQRQRSGVVIWPCSAPLSKRAPVTSPKPGSGTRIPFRDDWPCISGAWVTALTGGL